MKCLKIIGIPKWRTLCFSSDMNQYYQNYSSNVQDILVYGRCSTLSRISWQSEMPIQTEQTQIGLLLRLFLLSSEEAVWSGSTLSAIMASNLWIVALITNILFENRKIEVFEFLECLPWFYSLMLSDKSALLYIFTSVYTNIPSCERDESKTSFPQQEGIFVYSRVFVQ